MQNFGQALHTVVKPIVGDFDVILSSTLKFAKQALKLPYDVHSLEEVLDELQHRDLARTVHGLTPFLGPAQSEQKLGETKMQALLFVVKPATEVRNQLKVALRPLDNELRHMSTFKLDFQEKEVRDKLGDQDDIVTRTWEGQLGTTLDLCARLGPQFVEHVDKGCVFGAENINVLSQLREQAEAHCPSLRDGDSGHLKAVLDVKWEALLKTDNLAMLNENPYVEQAEIVKSLLTYHIAGKVIDIYTNLGRAAEDVRALIGDSKQP